MNGAKWAVDVSLNEIATRGGTWTKTSVYTARLREPGVAATPYDEISSRVIRLGIAANGRRGLKISVSCNVTCFACRTAFVSVGRSVAELWHVSRRISVGCCLNVAVKLRGRGFPY